MRECHTTITIILNGRYTYVQKVSEAYYSKNERAKHFLLCRFCFWCASSLTLEGLNRVIRCPACKNVLIGSTPIFCNEFHKIGYTKKNFCVDRIN